MIFVREDMLFEEVEGKTRKQKEARKIKNIVC
jgi:hypothetical protein